MATAPPWRRLLVLTLLLVVVWPAVARQHYRSKLPNGAAVPCPPDHDCAGEICVGLGHASCEGGVVTPERNAFGQDFERQGLRWTRELCRMDSDGDGFTNGEEMGDPCCIWHEGASLPLWMNAEEYEVTHPGFASSVPSQPPSRDDLALLCESTERLQPESFYNEGEERITVEFRIDDHDIPPEETVYHHARFNFPDDRSYHIVGVEPLVDNKEFVHHFVMKGCSIKTDTPGEPILDLQAMSVQCEEYIYIWAPGTGNFSAPKNAGIPVGKETLRVGGELEIHYDNPLEKEGQRDNSGVRVHLTPDLRKDEVGILWTGTIVSVGLLPPKQETVFSASICQLDINETVAPGGVQVFGYMPHMHLTGRRMWTDRIVVKSEDAHSDGNFVTDLNQLEKIGELARDDAWDFDLQHFGLIPPTPLRNGEFLATTCVYNTMDRDDFTSGGIGSYDEMCISFNYYYPAQALDALLMCSGPRYLGTSLPQNMTSFLDIANASDVGTSVPKWRQAYLSGEIQCNETGLNSLEISYERLSPEFWGKAIETCGSTGASAIQLGSDAMATLWECSKDCARLLYNHLGCALLEDAVQEDGKIFSLYGSPLEIIVEENCHEAFMEIYEEEKVSTDAASRG